MEQKRSRGRRVLAGLLALAILAGSALPSKAAGGGPSFGTIKENDMVPDAYCWTMHYRKGATEAEPFGNISQEAWKQYTNNGQLAHAKHQAVALVEENTPGQYGCWYRNVGQYKGKTVDFKVTVTGIRGAKERYDMTRVLALYKGQTPTSNWKNNLVKPCITFWTNRIGVSLVAVENADLRFEYYDHATGRLLEGIKGHGTFADLDGQQQVGFGNDSHIDHVYRLAGSHNISYKTEDGKTIALSADGSTSSSDKEGWLSWVFESHTLQFTFGYPQVIGGWDTADADTLDTKYNGDKAAYIAGLKRAYTNGDGTCYAEDYNGTPRYFEYAFFEFTSYMLGKFEPSKQHNKMVGGVGDAMDTIADAHEKEDPYRIYAYDEFEYQTSYYVMPVKLSSFEFQDTLADCLAIDGAHKVQITDNYGMDVTDDFTVKVSGQTVTCTAKEGALADDGFTNNRTYTLHLIAHRKEGGDVSPWLTGDGYTFCVPNKASIAFVSEQDGERYQLWTNEAWVQGKITSQLQVDKYADYEYEKDGIVDYTVKVFQKKPDGWAKNVVVSDLSLPEGLQLLDYTADWPAGAEHCKIERVGENAWEATCPLLRYDESIIIRFRCKIGKDFNGKEVLNTAVATADNFFDEYTGEEKSDSDSTDLWVNSPSFSIEKTVSRYEWQVDDAVQYQVVVNNTADYTVAKDVEIADLSLPKGLQLSEGDGAVSVTGLPETIRYPKADKKTGFSYDTKEVRSTLTKEKNAWRVQINDLPSNTPVAITFSCVAAEAANGTETQNQVSVSAANAETVWDDAEAYINTAAFSISKTADHYEWQVGEDIAYQVTVANTAAGTIARQVTIQDLCLPKGLALKEGDDAISVTGIPAAYLNKVAGTKDAASRLDADQYNETEETAIDWNLQREGEGWKLSISDLPCDTPVTIAFACTATQEMNGRESVNEASVQATNGTWVQDDAEVYVNTALLTVEKQIDNPYQEEKADGRLEEEFRVGEAIPYTLTVNNLQPGSIARDVVITDGPLPEGFQVDAGSLTVSGVPETIQDPVAGTKDADSRLDPDYYAETVEKEVTVRCEETAEGFRCGISDLPYNTPVTVTYTITPTEAVNGREIINAVSCGAANAQEVKASQKVWVNSPILKVHKEAAKKSYKYGDIATYGITVTQEQPGCVARDVEIRDVIETEGVSLQKNSIVLLDASGRVLDAPKEIIENTFTIHIGREVVKEAPYDIWDASQGGYIEQSLYNPLGLEQETALRAEYQVAVTGEELAGKTVKNLGTAASTEGGEGEDEEIIQIHSPELDLVKTSDKKTYHIGEKGYYKLTVRQLREDVTARRVSVADSFAGKGMVLEPDSLYATYNGERLQPAALSIEGNGFVLETGLDLKDSDKLEIFYAVTFQEEALAGTEAVNTAKAWGENTPEETQTHTACIIDLLPQLTVEKTSDKEAYRVGEIGHYTVTVTQTEKEAVARDVIVKDALSESDAQIVPGTINVLDGRGLRMDAAEIQYSDNRYTIFTGKNLAYGENFTVTYDVLFASDALAGRDIQNVARATGRNVYTAPEKEAAPVEITDTLTAKKSAVPASGSLVKEGEKITYTVEVENRGDKEKTVLIKDQIPSHMIFDGFGEGEEEIHQAALRTLDGNEYATFLVKLEAKETQKVTFTAAVKDAPEDEMLFNTAQIRTTLAEVEDINEDTWRQAGFRSTNSTRHYLDTLWASDTHTVQIDSGDLQLEKTSDKQHYAVGETGRYTLRITQEKEGAIAKNVVITDSLQGDGAAIDTDSIRITDADGTKIEGVGITADTNGFTMETFADLTYGNSFLVTYEVLFTKEPTGGQVKNTASAKHDAMPEGKEVKDTQTVSVGQAGLLLEKTSEKDSYQVGETAHYTLSVHTADDHFTAKNVTVCDVMEQPGAKLLADTVQVYLDGVRLKDVSLEKGDNAFTLHTGTDLSGSHILTVQYDVTMEKASLAGRKIVNKATADAENTTPSETEHQVSVSKSADGKDPNGAEGNPSLAISKYSDKASYSVGETGVYTLQVKTVGEAVAKNVTVTDTIQTAGAFLEKDSVIATVNGKALTDAKVTASDTGFTIDTKRGLTPSELLEITYRVVFQEDSLKGQTVFNEAQAAGDGLDMGKTSHSVSITDDSGKTSSTATPGASGKAGTSGVTFASSVKTEDTSPIKLFVILGVTGFAGIVVYFFGRKKGRKK